jgi:hypothetical protein
MFCVQENMSAFTITNACALLREIAWKCNLTLKRKRNWKPCPLAVTYAVERYIFHEHVSSYNYTLITRRLNAEDIWLSFAWCWLLSSTVDTCFTLIKNVGVWNTVIWTYFKVPLYAQKFKKWETKKKKKKLLEQSSNQHAVQKERVLIRRAFHPLFFSLSSEYYSFLFFSELP